MKIKLLIITTISLFIFSGVYASEKSENVLDYIVTEDGITFFKKLREGLNNNLVAITSDGDKLKFNKGDVKAYRKKGKEYKKLYLVEEGSIYVKKIFLERIVTKAGYTLYKKVNTGENLSLNDFYVYYNDKLELQLNQENHKTVLSFFFSKFNMLYAD